MITVKDQRKDRIRKALKDSGINFWKGEAPTDYHYRLILAITKAVLPGRQTNLNAYLRLMMRLKQRVV